MGKSIKQIFLTVKKNVRYRFILIVFVCCLLLLAITYSYALFTISLEKKNVISVVAGELNYHLSSLQYQNDTTITIPANSPISVDFTIESQNRIDSLFQLYYEGSLPDGVELSYVLEKGSPNDSISITGSKKSITVVIWNNTLQSQTLTFGVQGGFTGQTIVLAENRNPVTQVYAFEKDYAVNETYDTFIVPTSGYYKIETWGSEGGTQENIDKILGYGGYSSGVIYLEAGEKLYVCVRGKIEYAGGATDIRLIAGDYEDLESLRSRIMVAGGGGRTLGYLGANAGGAGGGLIGGRGILHSYGERTWYMDIPATGGGQSGGGQVGINSANNVPVLEDDYHPGAAGSFGIGGVTASDVISKKTGGFGYYGGGPYGYSNSSVSSAGGGSSYIAGYAGVNSVSANATENENPTHTNQTLHYSGKYFLDGQMEKGVNAGDGKAKITYVGQSYEKKHTKLNQVRYIKDCINENIVNSDNHWMELQAIKDGVNVAYQKSVTGTTSLMRKELIVDGIMDDGGYAQAGSGNQCITIDLGQVYDLDEIAVWHYYEDERTYYDHEMSVSNDNQHWTTVMKNSAQETSEGKRVNAWNDIVTQSETITVGQTYDFGTSNNMQTFTVPESGVYKIETWGSQGNTLSEKGVGGKGGYNSGLIFLSQNISLYIYARGLVGEGGGAADVRLIASAYDDTMGLRSRIMVAGGGGAATNYNIGAPGGSGGGLIGGTGSIDRTSDACALTLATGGTQYAGGQGSITDTGTCAGVSGTNGKFGLGGIYGGVQAGGDGYYGGGGRGFSNSVVSSGAGGSSFIAGHTGCIAVSQETGETIGNARHFSGMKFFQSVMQQGVWEGTAKVKITFVSR